MNKAQVVMYTMIVTSSLHLAWCYLLVFELGLEILGVCIATIVTYFLNFAIITVYCARDNELSESFFFFTRDSFHDL